MSGLLLGLAICFLGIAPAFGDAQNPLVPDFAITNAVVRTMVDGRVVYESAAHGPHDSGLRRGL